jgi:phosphate transport system substrate-binding protein
MFFALILSASLNTASAQTAVVKVDGSSTVFPITEAVAEEFQSAKKGAVNVTVGVSGTGGGFKKFCRGETDVQDASRPIQTSGDLAKPGEMETCKAANIKYFELPIAFDAIAIVVNKSNTWLDSVSVEDLKKIWSPDAQGKIMKWKDVNPKWPDVQLRLYGAGADSGTFDYFTEAVVGKAKSSRGDYTASEDDNVLVKGVAGEKGALGFIPYSYYESNKATLKLVAVTDKGKKPVLPSRQTVESGTYAPLSRPIFIYVNEASFKKAEVKDFVEFYIKNAERLVNDVKYIPLPSEAYKMASEHLTKSKLGTAFGGHSAVGMRIQDLMKKEKSL